MSFMRIDDLKVHYPVRGGIFNNVIDHIYAVDGITMEFERGRTYGLVGESGCGKSTTGRAIIGLERITSGRIFYEGVNVTNRIKSRKSAFNRDIQMIFQDSHSSLNPKKRIQDIIAEPIRNFLKLTPDEERRKINGLLDIVGIPEDAKYKYPYEFSGGQKQRIGIARAIATNPKLIIADEPVSALDLSVQAQILNFMKDIQTEYGLSYLFISHDLGVVRHMCDYISIMYKGRFVETGTRYDIYNNPQHIYTKRLLSAVPTASPIGRQKRKRERIRVEQQFQEHYNNDVDDKDKIFHLKPISHTHFVAASAAKGAI